MGVGVRVGRGVGVTVGNRVGVLVGVIVLVGVHVGVGVFVGNGVHRGTSVPCAGGGAPSTGAGVKLPSGAVAEHNVSAS